ncbi:hypothetical protein KA977_12365, partial [Candidatus Dependentiae bacterium]|nr:hypothetical protein [Candidatus Dependentiae bacterium]
TLSFNKNLYSKNIKKKSETNSPVFFTISVLNAEINNRNLINLEEFMLVPIDSIKSIIFKNYDEKIIESIVYDTNSAKISIKTNNKIGITPVTMEVFYNETYIEQTFFMNIVKSEFEKTFIYNSKKNIKISLAGDFNGWNPNANIMKKTGTDEYSTTLKLKAGAYKYKFVIDDTNWISDLSNQDSVPDGLGGYNSILSLGTPVNEKNINIISTSKTEKDSGVLFNFHIFSEQNIKSNIRAFFLINNKIIKEINDFKPGNIEILIDKKTIDSSLASQINNHIYKLNIMLISDGTYCSKSYELNLSKKIHNWKDSILYFIFTDRFYNYKNKSDFRIIDKELAVRANFLGGNFNGITKKIEDGYFSRIGINSIWITPVNENPDIPYRDSLPPHRKFSGYHGYWPVDSYKIEKNLGTLEDLKKMVKTAHKHKIKILVDFVANHIHQEHPLYKEHPEYFGILNLPDGRKNIRLYDEYPLTTWFDDFLPSFDYSNPNSVNYMVDNALWLIQETDIDGFRLDAVKHIDHIFWKKLKHRIKHEFEIPRKKIFYMVGESISEREKIMEYVNPGEINGQFDFPLYWDIRDIFAAELYGFEKLNKSFLNSLKIYGTESIMSNILGNHDFSRFMAYADGEFSTNFPDEKEYGWKHRVKVDNPYNYNKLTLAYAFLMTVPGIPLIYYGDEFGMTGANDPDNRRMMRFGKELSKHEKSVLKYVSKLNKIRKSNSVFRYGDFTPLAVEKEYYVYMLTHFNNKAIVILSRNFNGQMSISLPDWIKINQLKNAVTGTFINIKNNKFKINIKNHTAIILISKN